MFSSQFLRLSNSIIGKTEKYPEILYKNKYDNFYQVQTSISFGTNTIAQTFISLLEAPFTLIFFDTDQRGRELTFVFVDVG